MTNLPFLGEGDRNYELWLQARLVEWQKIGSNSGASFVDLSAAYPRYIGRDGLGFVFFMGIYKAQIAIGAFDTLLNLPPGYRVSGKPYPEDHLYTCWAFNASTGVESAIGVSVTSPHHPSLPNKVLNRVALPINSYIDLSPIIYKAST